MSRVRKSTFEDIDYNLEPYYRKLWNICDENGINLKRDFSVSDGGENRHLPQKYYGKNAANISYIFLTYYDVGFEVIGEIKIDIEMSILNLDFPNWGVFVECSINGQKNV